MISESSEVIISSEDEDETFSIKERSKCLCFAKLPEDVEMILCTNCGNTVHSICQGLYVVDDQTRKEFKCSNCNDSVAFRKYATMDYARVRYDAFSILLN